MTPAEAEAVAAVRVLLLHRARAHAHAMARTPRHATLVDLALWDLGWWYRNPLADHATTVCLLAEAATFGCTPEAARAALARGPAWVKAQVADALNPLPVG